VTLVAVEGTPVEAAAETSSVPDPHKGCDYMLCNDEM
jgi:hypothetical protein